MNLFLFIILIPQFSIALAEVICNGTPDVLDVVVFFDNPQDGESLSVDGSGCSEELLRDQTFNECNQAHNKEKRTKQLKIPLKVSVYVKFSGRKKWFSKLLQTEKVLICVGSLSSSGKVQNTTCMTQAQLSSSAPLFSATPGSYTLCAWLKYADGSCFHPWIARSDFLVIGSNDSKSTHEFDENARSATNQLSNTGIRLLNLQRNKNESDIRNIMQKTSIWKLSQSPENFAQFIEKFPSTKIVELSDSRPPPTFYHSYTNNNTKSVNKRYCILSVGSTEHDASISIVCDGKVLSVLELERLFGVRYYSPRHRMNDAQSYEKYIAAFRADWNLALKTIQEETGVYQFDIGVVGADRNHSWFINHSKWPVKRWVVAPHHRGHAALAFWDSPFSTAIVLAFDGLGGETIGMNKNLFTTVAPTQIFVGRKMFNNESYKSSRSKMAWDNIIQGGISNVALDGLALVEKVHLSTMAYAAMGYTLPLVNGSTLSDKSDDKKMNISQRLAQCNVDVNSSLRNITSLSGKCWGTPSNIPGRVMGFSALGKKNGQRDWVKILKQKWVRHGFSDMNLGSSNKSSGLAIMDLLRRDPRCKNVDNDSKNDKSKNNSCNYAQRDMATSIQTALEEQVISHISQIVKQLASQHIIVDGIAIAGGGALNVLLNSRIRREFQLPVHVPSAPGDGGLAVGFAWMHQPPKNYTISKDENLDRQFISHQHLAYVGFKLMDLIWKDKTISMGSHPRKTLESIANEYNAVKVKVSDLADILVGGSIVGVIRGRQEFGPRALGHRSLLAAPLKGMKERLNRLKVREWWRPVAPVLTLDSVALVFDEPDSFIVSPFMSFAPRLKPEMEQLAPAIWHYDGTARPQTVTNLDEPWLYSLLKEVGRRIPSKLPMLCNTSFNTKGRPIINRAMEALQLLNELKDLDYVLIESYLFSKNANQDIHEL